MAVAVEEGAKKRKEERTMLDNRGRQRHILTGRAIRKKDGREDWNQIANDARCKRQSQRRNKVKHQRPYIYIYIYIWFGARAKEPAN